MVSCFISMSIEELFIDQKCIYGAQVNKYQYYENIFANKCV